MGCGCSKTVNAQYLYDWLKRTLVGVNCISVVPSDGERKLQIEDSDCGGSSGVQFEPANTLFVAKSWPVGADPDVFFTTIQAAIDKAATLSPAWGSNITVQIAAGTYTENITLPPVGYVNLVAMSGPGEPTSDTQDVFIDGTISWLPSGGPNTLLSGLLVGGAISMDGGGYLLPIGCTLDGNVAVTLANGAQLLGVGTQIRNADLTTGSRIILNGGNHFGSFNLNASSMALREGARSLGVITLDNTSQLLDAVGAYIQSQIVMADAASTADIRGAECPTSPPATGSGKVNRSYEEVALVTSNATGVSVTWASLGLPPYINAPDHIAFMQQSGTAGVPLFPTITDTGFTYTDAAVRTGKIAIFQR